MGIYLHKRQTDVNDNLGVQTCGFGIFENSPQGAPDTNYKWLFYNINNDFTHTSVEFSNVHGIYIQTGMDLYSPNYTGLVLQHPDGKLSFFGREPVLQPTLIVPKEPWDGVSTAPEKLRSDLNIHQDLLMELYKKLGSGTNSNPDTINLFSYEQETL
jgi:hypothetical protein